MQVIDVPEDVLWTFPSPLTFSPDGRFLVMAANPHQVLDTGAGRWLAPLSSSDHDHVRFALGGQALAYCDYVTAVAVADFKTRTARRYELKRASARGLAATPDGRTLFLLVHLFDEPGSAVWRFDAATLKRRGQFARQKAEPWEMVGSADGRRLASGRSSRDRVIRIWDTTAPDRRAVVVTPELWAWRFALSGDGARLATVGTRGVTLWTADTGREVWSSGKHRRGVQTAGFCPTRPLLATGDNAGVIFLWDFTGRVLARYDFGLKDVHGLAFAPDGLRCAATGPRSVVLWDIDV
jgi:WD40 repeat protein